METIFELVEKYGTDKTLSGYTSTYDQLFEPIKNNITSVLEIGLGTLNPSIPSSFVGNTQHFSHYKPGGSLRVWKDFFPNAQVYGVDIAKDCMFEEDRIKTFLFDSSDNEYTEYYLNNLEFDIIIDDGNHDPQYQIKTLKNLFPKLKEKGYYIIEDIGGYQGNENLLIEYLDEFNNITKEYKISNKGNHIIIQKIKIPKSLNSNLTLVSGLWNISRTGRNFEEHYIPRFKEFLQIEANMVLFIPSYLEEIVWEYRNPLNTFVKIFELEDIKDLYSPHWDKTQEIRTSDKWLNITGEGGWLKSSPQATLEWYNPVVQSKMFMLHDSSIWNPFNTDYFFWLDAGITNTVPAGHLVNDKCLDKIIPYSNPFIFLSYPYESAGEIHGFDFQAMNQIAGSKVKYVCRGGLFGGHKDQIHDANSMYYALLQNSLNQGYMGTEESIFTLMSYIEPHLYRRYMLDDNGLIVKFTENLIKDNITLEPLPTTSPIAPLRITDKDLSKYKTNLYILTFNFPEQLLHTIESMKKTPEWLEKPHLVLLDNSTDEEAKSQNKKIAAEYKFEYIHLGGNTGICGGRQYAAEHFHDSDADFMFFFEDDMTANPPEYSGQFCRNGFRKYIPNLYNIVHKIMLKENFDFLKLSYTEVYMDNNIQVSWYNVPQDIRTRDWPHYDKLPVTGLDPNAPRTKFKNINILDSVSYIDGEIYYANWPMIVSKAGNKKMFIDTKWAHPFEQTWMSYMYQETIKDNLNPAVLLASPIWHDRIKYYKPEERREN
jgi:hypothetical protein